MNQAEIIAMAKEAGLLPDNSHPAPETRAMRQRANAVQRFAALVAAKRTEENAQLCESVAKQWAFHLVALSAALQCAADIRARGTKEGA